jgi:hypothetical protein
MHLLCRPNGNVNIATNARILQTHRFFHCDLIERVHRHCMAVTIHLD